MTAGIGSGGASGVGASDTSNVSGSDASNVSGSDASDVETSDAGSSTAAVAGSAASSEDSLVSAEEGGDDTDSERSLSEGSPGVGCAGSWAVSSLPLVPPVIPLRVGRNHYQCANYPPGSVLEPGSLG